MKSTMVSVLMPVYNGDKYLTEAIDSVLKQTFKTFELIIINDGSTDSSVKIVESYHDPRIKLIHNKENVKIVASLNKGLQLATGEYIARMDCDDIMEPNRLARQVEHLNANPLLQVVGCWWRNIDSCGTVTGIQKLPEMPFECDFWFYLLGEQPVGHPCVMFRRETALSLGGYRESYPYAEDAEFWFRFAMFDYKFSNIKEPLMFYRCHDGQLTKQFNRISEDSHNKALAVFMSQKLGYDVLKEEACLYRQISNVHSPIRSSDDLNKIISLKLEMAERYLNIRRLENKQIVIIVANIFCSLLPLVKLKYFNSKLTFSKIDAICRKLLLKHVKSNLLLKFGYAALYYFAVAVRCLKQIIITDPHGTAY